MNPEYIYYFISYSYPLPTHFLNIEKVCVKNWIFEILKNSHQKIVIYAGNGYVGTHLAQKLQTYDFSIDNIESVVKTSALDILKQRLNSRF